jgi:hypothetical protein
MPVKAILAICIGYGAGIWFFVLGLKKRLLLSRAIGWLPTRGRVLESLVYTDPTRNRTHFRVRYEFFVDERMEGSTPRIAGDWFWNQKQQADFVARYIPGQEVEVFYDPRDPTRNCLDRTDRSGILCMWMIALGGTVLASFLVWLVFIEGH